MLNWVAREETVDLREIGQRSDIEAQIHDLKEDEKGLHDREGCSGEILRCSENPSARLRIRRRRRGAVTGRGSWKLDWRGPRSVAGIDAISYWFNRSEEAIAATGEGFDKSGTAGRVAESLADTIDRGVDAVLVVDEGAFGPKHASDFIARDQLTGPVQIPVKQHEKDLEGLCVELDTHSLLAQFTCGGVRFKDSKAITPVWPKVAPQVCHSFRSV